MITTSPMRNLLALSYLAGVLVLADQIADLAATLLATNAAPGLASWRFGAFGLMASRGSVFLLADVMLFIGAIGLGHRRVLRALGIGHLLIAGLILGGLVLFALDWIQVRSRVKASATRPFDLAAVRAAGVAALGLAIATWAGVVCIKSSRGRPKNLRREGEASPLLTDIRRDETVA